MDLFEAIKARYSYRGEFTEEEIPKENLIKIVQAGLDAPSGKNLQTTEFVIVENEDALSKLKSILPDKKVMTTAKAIICCIVDKHPEDSYHGSHFQIEDCAAAVENMLLAISALGYASVWLDGVLRINNISEQMGKVLCLPESKKVQIILPLGVPASEGTRKEKMKFEERVRFNSYQV